MGKVSQEEPTDPVIAANHSGFVVEDEPGSRELLAQLAQTQRIEAVGRLAGGIAHDFNNVLTVILGETQMALRRVPDDDPLAGTLEEIKAAGDRAAALTRQLLMFSRKQLVEPRVFDMNEAIRGMDSMMRRLIGEDLKLQTTFASTALPILTDPGQFEQALVNLVINARAAMAQGGELSIASGTATFDAAFVRSNLGAREGDYVLLEVADTGVGMTEEVQALIFEPFFSTKPSGEGTGLGLSQVYGIVKKADGYITVNSSPGEGTTFKIYFPLMTQGALEPLANVRATTAGAGGDEAILLVEDDDRVRGTAKRMLEEAGYLVVAVDSGADALLHLEETGSHFDLLLTDVVMPEMGGREVAERVLEVRPGIRVLFATGYTDDVVLQRQLIDRDAELLNKPFTYELLTKKVREMLDAPTEPRQQPSGVEN